MDNNKTDKTPQDIEIDVVALLTKVWAKRWSIVKVTCCFFVLGIVVALITPRRYTAVRVFIPQSNASTGRSGSLSSLASLAGISLGDELQDGPMSPLAYPHILSNVEFQKELIMTPVNFKGLDELVSLYDYYTDPQYDKHPFLTGLKKYTIGLPGTIKEKMRGDEDLKSDSLSKGVISGSRILKMTRKESEVEAERLASEVALAQQLYTSLANNLLAAKVKVKEENVVFTDISPVSVPDKPSNSKRKTVMVWTFLGFILACGWVIGRDFVREQLANAKK